MNRLTLAACALVACVLVALLAEPAFADCGCGGPASRPSPSRSSLSGLGVGLGGIAMAWGAMWLGFRFVGRIRRK